VAVTDGSIWVFFLLRSCSPPTVPGASIGDTAEKPFASLYYTNTDMMLEMGFETTSNVVGYPSVSIVSPNMRQPRHWQIDRGK
jgi:hypothetical protein